MCHRRRPRILKLKCLAQKLLKWRRIEKMRRKHEIDRFPKIERFALCKICYLPSTMWLSFCSGWSDFDETCLYGFVITNGKKSRSAKAPNSAEFEGLKMKFTPFSHEFHPFFLTPFLNESHPFFRWNSPLFKYEFHPFSTWISPLFITTFMIEYHPLYEIHYFIKDNSRRCIGTISIPF